MAKNQEETNADMEQKQPVSFTNKSDKMADNSASPISLIEVNSEREYVEQNPD